MAHFAELNGENIVIRVVAIDNDIIINEYGVEDENLGINYCNYIFRSTKSQLTTWKQTSYNNKIRVRFAYVGCSYNEEFDAFIPPKPFDSWVLDETEMDWISPLGQKPELTSQEIDDGYFYYWEENLYNIDNTKGWILENSRSAKIIGSSVLDCGGKILLEFDKNILETEYDINQINKAISIIIQDEIFTNIISSIFFLNSGDRNFLIINLANCEIIQSWQDIFITYNKYNMRICIFNSYLI